MKRLLVIALFLAAVGTALYAYPENAPRQLFKKENATAAGNPVESAKTPETIAEGLDIPWEIAFLPGGDILVTERPGRLIRIGADKKIIEISGVVHRGEGGLLGLALHPRFAENGFLYLYVTAQEGSRLVNRVERYKLIGDALSMRAVIIDSIPAALNHDGGRLAFGPDGMLYITTGDAGDSGNAQDTSSLAGKILRVEGDGSIPSDNPFTSTGSVQAAAVYSYGHRNVQGIAWDDTGQLWATEHGRSGVLSGYDELNKIVKGGNYGWPEIQGNETRAGMIAPEIQSGAEETWAPSGMAYLRGPSTGADVNPIGPSTDADHGPVGHVIFAGLRGESLYAVDIENGNAKDLKRYFRGEYGRLRTVAVGPDGMLYVLTNNRDGRGNPNSSDDRIIRIDPRLLEL